MADDSVALESGADRGTTGNGTYTGSLPDRRRKKPCCLSRGENLRHQTAIDAVSPLRSGAGGSSLARLLLFVERPRRGPILEKHIDDLYGPVPACSARRTQYRTTKHRGCCLGRAYRNASGRSAQS